MSDDPPCGLDVALAVVGGKWKPLILFHLQSGPRRFGELRRRVAGVSEKVLIQHLRELVAAGVLTRRDHRRLPPVVDYAVTPFGLTLVQALTPLCAWGVEHRARVEALTASQGPRPGGAPGRGRDGAGRPPDAP